MGKKVNGMAELRPGMAMRRSAGILAAAVSVITLLLVVPAIGAGGVARSSSSWARTASQSSDSHTTSTGTSLTYGEATATLSGVGASAMPISIDVGPPVEVSTASGTTFAVSALVAVGAGTPVLRPSAQFSGGACGWDGLDDTVYECVTMYYNIKSDYANFFADDAQVSDEAVNGDPHDAVLTKTTLTTGGVGTPCNSGSELNGGQTWNISSPTSGTTYYESPSWAGNYYRLYSLAGNFQNVQGTLYYTYHGNPYSLEFTYTLPDSESGWPQGGCSN